MSSSTSSSERRYVLWLAVFTAPLFIVLCLNYLFLRNAGELTAIPAILSLQQNPDTFCLYGTALYGDTYRYKMDALALRKPAIITIGSSRMLTLREHFFTQPFYNLSNTVSNLHEGRDVVEGILASAHRPQTVIRHRLLVVQRRVHPSDRVPPAIRTSAPVRRVFPLQTDPLAQGKENHTDGLRPYPSSPCGPRNPVQHRHPGTQAPQRICTRRIAVLLH